MKEGTNNGWEELTVTSRVELCREYKLRLIDFKTRAIPMAGLNSCPI